MSSGWVFSLFPTFEMIIFSSIVISSSSFSHYFLFAFGQSIFSFLVVWCFCRFVGLFSSFGISVLFSWSIFPFFSSGFLLSDGVYWWSNYHSLVDQLGWSSISCIVIFCLTPSRSFYLKFLGPWKPFCILAYKHSTVYTKLLCRCIISNSDLKPKDLKS